MAIIKNDTFTEASDTPLESHTSDSGGGWSGANTTNFDILAATNEVKQDSAATNWATGDEVSGGTDYHCTINGKTGSTAGARMGCVVRFIDLSNFYYFYLDNGGTWKVYKKVSGSWTLLNSGTLAGFSNTTYYDIKLEYISGSLIASIDAVDKYNATVSDLTADGVIAIAIATTSPRITSLLAETPAVGGLSIPVAMHHYNQMRL